MTALEKLKSTAVNKVTESIATRLMRNAGIEDMIDNPKNYKAEFYFDDNGMTLKIEKIK